MKAPRRGEIHWVDWPRGDTKGSEQFGHPERPYIIISDPDVARGGVVVGIPCSTKADPNLRWHAEVPLAEVDTKGAPRPMNKDTVAMCEQIRVIAYRERCKGKAGRLSTLAMVRVETALTDTLAL